MRVPHPPTFLRIFSSCFVSCEIADTYLRDIAYQHFVYVRKYLEFYYDFMFNIIIIKVVFNIHVNYFFLCVSEFTEDAFVFRWVFLNIYVFS